jgi:hypothetical protein
MPYHFMCCLDYPGIAGVGWGNGVGYFVLLEISQGLKDCENDGTRTRTGTGSNGDGKGKGKGNHGNHGSESWRLGCMGIGIMK